nr:vacuolar transporter chaperone 4 [Quercus suber]
MKWSGDGRWRKRRGKNWDKKMGRRTSRVASSATEGMLSLNPQPQLECRDRLARPACGTSREVGAHTVGRNTASIASCRFGLCSTAMPTARKKQSRDAPSVAVKQKSNGREHVYLMLEDRRCLPRCDSGGISWTTSPSRPFVDVDVRRSVSDPGRTMIMAGWEFCTTHRCSVAEQAHLTEAGGGDGGDGGGGGGGGRPVQMLDAPADDDISGGHWRAHVRTFGQQLRSSLIKDWYYYYISYDDLKKSLRTDFEHTPIVQTGQKGKRKPWAEEDEQRFVNDLEQELDKVFTFQKVKSQEIIRRINASEKEVSEVIARTEAANQDDRAKADAPDEDEYLLLEEDLSDIIADVHDLAKFTQLNYTGFQKIIKKHDKLTHWHLKPVFAARLNARPFFKDDYDGTVVKLSKLYDLVRTRGNPTKGDSSAGGKQQNFVRQTTKYWVHPDNITELKLIILKHLPVLVFNPSKEFERKDSAISSIYYDNTDTWELYEGRLKKTEGAEAIRLRWYGGMETDTIFLERKTHREDWTGEKSVKARFSLKEKNVNAFLRGDMTTEQAFEKMRREGKKSEKEIDDLEQLAKEIQFRVIDRRLEPVCRSFYNRTAFQLPGDARVRISLDTELSMIREDNLDGRKRSADNWRRMDIGVDWPFSQLPKQDVELFPYGVLEVKLQTAAGQQPPEWIKELTASHLVEAVPKFSKFIHGTATMFPTRIDLLPFWFPQMSTDIRKPISHNFGLDRPGQSTDASTSAAMDDDTDDELDAEDDEHENAQDDENVRRLRAARDALEQHEEERRMEDTNGGNANVLDEEERMAHKPLAHVDDDYPLYDSDDEEEALAEAKRIGGWTYRWKLVKSHAAMVGDKLLYTLKQATPAPAPTALPARGGAMGVPSTNAVSEKRFKAPKGKKIHVPVRVEPKVSFAAERTFLAWLEFSIIIGSIAATLLNFGDAVSLASAWAFTVIAVLALAYSMAIYLWRVDGIKNRRALNYHDKWGPTLLCFGLVGAVVVSFVYRFVKGGEGDLRGRTGAA